MPTQAAYTVADANTNEKNSSESIQVSDAFAEV